MSAASKKWVNRLAFGAFGLCLAAVTIGSVVLIRAIRGRDKIIDGAASLAPKTIESFGPGWAGAKQALLDGDWAKASGAFKALEARHPANSAAHDWAIIHEALAEQFRSGGEAAAGVLARLPDNSTQLRKFFGETIRSRLAESARVPATAGKDFSPRNHEALGALFLALHDYALDDFDDSKRLLRQFCALDPEPGLAWLEDYKLLANPYDEELTAYTFATEGWKHARTEREQEQVLRILRALPGRLPENGRCLPKARQLIAEADQRVATAIANRNKNNAAFKSTATASASNIDDPPGNAVDGDPATAWSADGPEQQWLAVDLGSPKPISRWAVRLAGSGGGTPARNLAAFKLQWSEDGAAWTDADNVEYNRLGIVDRVVPEFTARHVRVLVPSETRQPEDGTVRIHELWLGAAADQSGTGYEPSDTVAMRFSTATPFIGGPIGSIEPVGTMQFDEKAGKFTVSGGGSGTLGNAGGFQFVWQPVIGDCEIIARVEAFHDAPNARGGLMILADLARESNHCGIFVSPDGRMEFISRTDTENPGRSLPKPGEPLPRWLKIARQGGTLIGYDSADGKTWTEVGRGDPADLHPVAFVGMAVGSRVKGRLATGEFADVQFRKTNP